MAAADADSGSSGPLAGAGQPRRQQEHVPAARRIGAWVIWWTLLMALWVWVDDSVDLAELLGGAAVAAMGASFVELVSHQSATRFRARFEWLSQLVSVPPALVKDTLLALTVLWRRLLRGEQPKSGYRVVPKVYGDESPEGLTRRALLTGGRSITPNTFVVGLDRDTDLMVVHQLVITEGTPLDTPHGVDTRGKP
jgi:multisubunit Na+/H+ antiporter MnhE subunit